jgi:large subunit ribosomal protein L13
MKTWTPKPEDIQPNWLIVDAQDAILGRLATQVASRLRGKHKPEFAPHMDMGDFVIVVNAEKVKVTGAKETDKMYYKHTGFPGGLKEMSLQKMRAKKPEIIIQQAVKGMLPKNRLGSKLLKKLKVYAGPEHPHEAQNPKPLEL